jgi:beta-lactamase class A
MKNRVLISAAITCALGSQPGPTIAAPLQKDKLQIEFQTLTRGFDGRVGICAQDETGLACAKGDQRFSLQSVMKLLVGLAVMDAVDHRGWRLDEEIVVRKEDLSLYVQPIAELVKDQGYRTTVGDLVRRAIVDSDSAAADILVGRLDGPKEVQPSLDRRAISGVRFDRDERHLQTEILGLEWRSEFVDPAILESAIAGVPQEHRDMSYRQYQTDPRDTATPRAMASLLYALANGKLLSPTSTTYLLEMMSKTVTFPDRLKAGVSKGWKLGHKTGTSGTWEGVTAATNDVGLLTAPDGHKISIVVFVGDSREAPSKRAAIIASAARLTISHYQ